jgi:hypothetical protein
VRGEHVIAVVLADVRGIDSASSAASLMQVEDV